VKKLQKLLHVNKKDTVLAKMKKISVYEGRPSAVGMGITSSVALIVLIFMILISDIPVLVRHYRHFWPQNRAISPSG